MRPAPITERNGWKLYAHPAFSQILETLIRTVEALEKRYPQGYRDHPKTKLLKRTLDLILLEVPRDPNAAQFQLGNTMGPANRHWRRAKFLSRFRLFFRFSRIHKALVYAWVNDEATLRKAGAQTDPYAVFARRLREGNPPDNWDALFREAERVEPRLDPDLKRTTRKR